MSLNANQKEIRLGYGEIAQELGSVMGVYRPSNLSFAPICDPRNWLFDIPFSASINSGYQSTQKYGLPSFQGFFDSTDIQVGDIFSDNVNTFFVGDLPLFEEPMVVQCFNTLTLASRAWDGATRTHVDTITVNAAPCNVQMGGVKAFDKDPQSFSNPDSQQTWIIETWLRSGVISINDEITLDTGQRMQVTNVFLTQHGSSIRATEILGDNYNTVA